MIDRYVLENLARLHGPLWLGASKSKDYRPSGDGFQFTELESWNLPLDAKTKKRLEGFRDLTEVLRRFSLKGVRLDSQLGLLGLLDRSFALDVRHDIPTPDEMLAHQCEGRRFVTLLLAPEDQERPIGRFNGAFEFLMHDLEHANKFFGNPSSHRGQVRFFNKLRQVLPRFEPWFRDPLFKKDMDYLKSDMNSHPVHLFKYLKAIVLTSSLRLGGDTSLNKMWTEVGELWQMDEQTSRSALNINHPGIESEEDQRRIAGFFMRTDA
jgi:hypothetical protein